MDECGLDQYLKRVPAEEFQKGRQLYTNHSGHLYLVVDGYVKLDHSLDHGRIVQLGVRGPAQFFGELGLLVKEPPAETAIVRSKTATIMRWQYDDVLGMLAGYESAKWEIAKLVARRSAGYVERMAGLHCLQTGDRLIRRLDQLLNEFGEPVKEGVTALPAWFTHQMLANELGTSREIVTSSISRLRRDGVVVRWGRSPQRLAVRRDLLASLLSARAKKMAA